MLLLSRVLDYKVAKIRYLERFPCGLRTALVSRDARRSASSALRCASRLTNVPMLCATQLGTALVKVPVEYRGQHSHADEQYNAGDDQTRTQ